MSSVEIKINKFGQVFSSRPEGRETALALIAYHLTDKNQKSLLIDFEGVLIMTPSWLSEFIQTLKTHGFKNIEYKNMTNKSVKSSLEMVLTESN